MTINFNQIKFFSNQILLEFPYGGIYNFKIFYIQLKKWNLKLKFYLLLKIFLLTIKDPPGYTIF